jgi:uncharacterized protein (DUF427 family)
MPTEEAMTRAAVLAPAHPTGLEPSPRWVRVRFAGQVVADTKGVLLFRGSGRLPVYYFPYECVASYYSVRTGGAVVEDVAWCYRHPIPECSKIENLVCFFNERVDALHVDGELQPRPRTRWSTGSTPAPA